MIQYIIAWVAYLDQRWHEVVHDPANADVRAAALRQRNRV